MCLCGEYRLSVYNRSTWLVVRCRGMCIIGYDFGVSAAGVIMVDVCVNWY